jgi:hypothetical protein
MTVADMVGVVAMEIHVAPPGGIFDPETLGAANRGQAGCRYRLMEEIAGVLGQPLASRFIEMGVLPDLSPGG